MERKDSVVIKKLSKKYSNISALNNLSLNVKENEIFGLLGPNGAGKTTLINILSTLLKSSEGKAFVNGFNVKNNSSKVRESIGTVFQETILDLELTATENLEFHGRLYKMPKNTIKKKVAEMLDLVGLSECKDRKVSTFSGGMKRRLEIARGLLHNPKVLFLDEPTLGLDPQTRRHIWDYISNLKKKEKITILLTTHYMEEADYLCDRVAIIDNGKIITLGKPEKLKSTLEGDMVNIKLKRVDNKIIDGLKKIKSVKEIKTSMNTISLITKRPESKIIKFIDIIKSLNGEINEISVHKPTLEDVFLHYTGKQIKNDS